MSKRTFVRTFVRDDKGLDHSEVHGVPVSEWDDKVREARVQLREVPGQIGLARFDGDALCSDPDCARLHRHGGPRRACWKLVRDIARVMLLDKSDDHPWRKGALICDRCAAMGMAKRLIDAAPAKR
jgi:hypothetical protein